MKLPHRRQFLHLAAGAAALPAVSRITWAQTYPTRPVRLIAGFPPGGVVDMYARLISQSLSERLGQQFVVENRAGAGGNLAVEATIKAAPRWLHAAHDRFQQRLERDALRQSQFQFHPSSVKNSVSGKFELGG